MIRKIAAFLLMSAITLASFVYAAQPAIAANDWNQKACDEADEAQKAVLGCGTDSTAPSVVEALINGVIAIVGIVAVIIIIVGGQRFIVSQGDPQKINAARGMIIYGVIGLIVALVAFGVVNFVLKGVFSK
ncbi:hypothetical protein IKG54_00020 [Candidatus Saccharibacteria bacterium]|nr:hypothetical protein [Candidatus Saccharibacteria bacterium]